MVKPCDDCAGKGTIKTVQTERVWNKETKKFKIVVKEVKKPCPTCNGWGLL